MKKWTIEDSKELYNINGWGTSYFGVNESGNIFVNPSKNNVKIDIREVIDELALRDVTPPVLLRFPDILDNRIEKMASCFKKAAKEYNYKGESFIIYPIKVNQMQPVVDEIISHGRKFNLGLEAGSKPELHAVIAAQCKSDSLIICNGYKDENYIELAMLAQKLGKHIFLVVEKLNEIDVIAKAAKRLNVKPNLGIRIKLASSGSGKWAESGGDASKFGLTSSELLQAFDKLNELGLNYYVNLRKMGHNIEYVDCGGGLGVDYDGTRSSNSESSVNYSIQEYINDCVYAFTDVANRNDIPHPNIITESGRSLAAHHSVLVIDVLGAASLPVMPEEFEAKDTDHKLVKDLYEIWCNLTPKTMLEDWHDVDQIREDSLDLFAHGMIDLKTRAEIEAMYWSVCHEINGLTRGMKHIPDELRGLDKLLADKYFCNFSLFQSLPDCWGIDQLFPIMPIQRLDERPSRNCTLQDITCDSDGKISNFVAGGTLSNVLPVHALRKNEPYYIGVFLVGAYQEILGDMHNLFGDTNAAHISVKDDTYHIDQLIDGETVEEVLEYVQYNPKKLVRQIEQWVTKCVKEGKISLEEGKEFLSNYRSGLYGYTYLK